MFAAVANCSLATLALPPVEGTSALVPVGQPNPCPPPGLTSDYLVVTDFGDGTPAVETPIADERLWLVGGRHTYRRAGTYAMRATLTPRAGGTPIVLTRQLPVRNAPLTKVATRQPRRNKPNQTLAKFADGNKLAEPSDFEATVDGRKARVVKLGPGRFAIKGTATSRTPKIRVEDDRGASLKLP